MFTETKISSKSLKKLEISPGNALLVLMDIYKKDKSKIETLQKIYLLGARSKEAVDKVHQDLKLENYLAYDDLGDLKKATDCLLQIKHSLVYQWPTVVIRHNNKLQSVFR